MTSIRPQFDEELTALQQEVVRMGGLAAEAIQTAIQALVQRDLQLVAKVREIENRIDALNLDIENRGLQLLALQQPMARDLRTIAAILRVITDIERIGDYSVDISTQAKALADRPLFKPLVDIPRMGEMVQRMLHDSLKAFVNRDLELAQAAVEQDDEVDHLYRALHEELEGYIQKDPALTFQAIRLLMVSAYLERIADHITNIGERIFYMVTGELKELHL
jgi:phosphate transport system protein